MVTATEELSKRVHFLLNAMGTCASPFDCWLVLRGIETLPVRMRQHEQNAFAVAPPSVSLQNDLGPLRDELQRMVEFFFRPETLARSEEDFDLGLTSLEALFCLNDPTASVFVPRVKEIGVSWVAKQLEQFLNETRTAWAQSDSSSTSAPSGVVCAACEALQAIAF